MNLKGRTLLIPDKPDEERDAVAKAWSDAGGDVIRLARFWEPPQLKAESLCVYGGNNFSQIVAQKLGLELISPADDFLLRLDPKWLKRELFYKRLSEARTVHFPTFAKSIVPKIFRAAVFSSFEELEGKCKGLVPETRVLFSEIVRFECEARAFALQGGLLDYSIYEGTGVLQEAGEFLRNFLKSQSLPPTCVIDIGFITGRGWAVVELNASCGAGLNGCHPDLVISAIAGATINKREDC